jgi:sugar/nucleoside kinase (ribokinase family)
MVAQSSDVCVVGSFSLDSIVIVNHDSPFRTLGGAATYTSFAVKALEKSVSVLSRVGSDFPESYLQLLHNKGIDVSSVKRYSQETTTHFDLRYNVDFSERVLKLTCKGQPISLNDIPASLRVKAIHVAPIADEISYEIIQHLRDCCDIISFDPQGFLRSFDENGNVAPKRHVDLHILDLVNICKLSQDELFVLTGKSEFKEAIKAVHDVGVETVIVTMGANGSLLSVENTCYSVPVCKPTIVVDPTGAGDVFIGAFLAEYLKGRESLWCASVGSAAASFIVENRGSSCMGTTDQIYQRAQNICENKIKL